MQKGPSPTPPPPKTFIIAGRGQGPFFPGVTSAPGRQNDKTPATASCKANKRSFIHCSQGLNDEAALMSFLAAICSRCRRNNFKRQPSGDEEALRMATASLVELL